MAASLVPRSLVWATDIDVLTADRVLQRHQDCVVVRSPGNPRHFWGNFLLFGDAPHPGDAQRWERRFEELFAGHPEVGHRAFGWDRVDGENGAAGEFRERGYELQETVGLVAAPGAVRAHPRANREVTIRALDPRGDTEWWARVVELQVAGREPRFSEASYRRFRQTRIGDLRAMFASGRGSWYAAVLGDEVVASCGIVVTGGRGRFQAVDTAQAHRRRGICSRLVADAARDAADRFGARSLVIAADVHYHALGLYESLGFARRERVAGVELARV